MICKIEIDMHHSAYVNVRHTLEAENIAQEAIKMMAKRRPPKVTSVIEDFQANRMMDEATEFYMNGATYDETVVLLKAYLDKVMDEESTSSMIRGLMVEVIHRTAVAQAEGTLINGLDLKVIYSHPRDVFDGEYTEFRLALQADKQWVVGIWKASTGKLTGTAFFGLGDFELAQRTYERWCDEYNATKNNRQVGLS